MIIEESKKPFLDNFSCTFLENQDERFKKMTECINKAKNHIYILSDLSHEKETKKSEHHDYTNALNDFLKNKKQRKFLRIVVPSQSLLKDTPSETEIVNRIKKHKGYEGHFNLIIKYSKRSLFRLLGGPTGVSILLVDNNYLFIVIENYYKEELLGEILANGFFFEDYSKNLTNRFKECFEYLIMGENCKVVE